MTTYQLLGSLVLGLGFCNLIPILREPRKWTTIINYFAFAVSCSIGIKILCS